MFRSTILLKMCRAKAAMQQHEEALDFCEQAYCLRHIAWNDWDLPYTGEYF